MPKTRVVEWVGVAGLAALLACSDHPTDLPNAGPALDAGSAAAVERSATGGGTLDVTSPPAAIGEASFAFHALRRADGTADGHFTMVRPRAGFIVDFAGRVTCMSTDPANNRVWIGGVVTRNNSTDPNHLTPIHEVGRDVWFRVVDNGEGAVAEPDRSSVYGFEGAAGIITSPEYCAAQLWPADNANAFVVTHGNIQVRNP